MLNGLYIPPRLKVPPDPPQGTEGHGCREGHLGYVWEPLPSGSGKLIDGWNTLLCIFQPGEQHLHNLFMKQAHVTNFCLKFLAV